MPSGLKGEKGLRKYLITLSVGSEYLFDFMEDFPQALLY